ncbi:MAG: OprO/OprP family phosphate-selective porin [Muribaculaceae bacterium]|nr:OprO/OprP family phosphate-selective porin [Muribaculaceae bacterium]
MRTSIILAAAIAAALPAMAQNPETLQADPQAATDKPKFEIKPTGRILMDAGAFISPDKDLFKDGFAIPDVRLGAKMKYGKWDAKIDVGFAYGKVGLKDLSIGYTFNEQNILKVGSFIHQFGLQSATSSSMKPTMEEPISNSVFNDARQIGVQYEYNGDKFLATASFHVEPSATNYILRPTQFTQEGYGVRSRLVYRPFHEAGKMVQVGISGAFGTPQRYGDPDTHNAFQFAANFPSRIQQISALKADVTDAKNLFKLSPELLLSYQRLALESQYFWVNVNRRNGLSAYNAQGAYVTLRGMLLGNGYTYDSVGGGIATPAPKTLELVLNYNYTSLTDASAGIYGGRLNDFSATLNYQINKYMIARLHYSYTHTWDGSPNPTSLSAIMARLQVIF